MNATGIPDRYHVTVWHGENGSMFEIRDRRHPDDCWGMFSTISHGGYARQIADKQCSKLNGAQK